jgi:hypothetical protein
MAKKSKTCDTCENLGAGLIVAVILLVGGIIGWCVGGGGYDKGCRRAYNTLKGTSYSALTCDDLLR